MGRSNKTIKEKQRRNHIKMVEFKETRRQTVIRKNTTLAETEVRRRQRFSWDKFVKNLAHENFRTQTKVYKILKQISKDVNETAHIQGNIDENVFLEYYEIYGTQQT